MRKIDTIIIHCSATREGRNIRVNDIDRWHRERGFSCIGYHFVIYLDGSIHCGRDVECEGAHCIGHNKHSIGICYIGGMSASLMQPKDTRTEPQKKALITLLRQLKAKYPNAKVYGHRDFAARDCPCFDAKTEYANI